MINPESRVKKNEAKKDEAVYTSLNKPATRKGNSIDELKTINNNPKVFCTD
jgi:hypothetical protein